MPSSAPDHIPVVLKHVMRLKPKRVLDVGLGYGKWGFLLREYLESWNDRVHPSSWEVEIVGVEVWEPYTRLPWVSQVYSEVIQRDIRECSFHRPFDVAICGDVLEHMPKRDALQVLEHLLEQCGEVIVNVPIGKEWLNNQIVDGNPYEKHQSDWTTDELLSLKGTKGVLLHDYMTGTKRVATVAIRKEQVQVKSPSSPSVQSDCKRTILHVHNVQQIGGTGNFVWDFARTFPEFNHVALAVNDPNGDKTWLNWVSHHMRPLYAPKLTRQLVEEIDPVCVILHNTAGKSVEGDHHLEILKDRFVVFVHHNPTHPLFETNVDVDVFVSGYVLSKYTSIVNRMKLVKQIPPCVHDLGDFGRLTLPPFNQVKATAAGKGGKHFGAWSARLPVQVDPGPQKRGMNVMPGYLKQFNTAVIWSGLDESWCRTATECMAAGMVVLAHDNGALREQIQHGQNGFLFDTETQLLGLIRDLQFHMTQDQKLEIGQAARSWALREVGPDRMKRDWYPILMQALMR